MDTDPWPWPFHARQTGQLLLWGGSPGASPTTPPQVSPGGRELCHWVPCLWGNRERTGGDQLVLAQLSPFLPSP